MKKAHLYVAEWLGLLAFAASTTVVTAANPVINEIMYNPASGNLLESYVEVLNTGNTPLDLSGYRFTKGIDYVFPTNTVLGAGNLLVVAANSAAFHQKYPEVTNYVAGWVPPMTSHLKLTDATGQVVSDVNYSDDGDWAARILTTNGFWSYGHWGWMWSAAHDGQGSSLELVNAGLPNSYALNWGSSSAANGTPGQANSIATTNAGPIITSVAHSPVIPGPTDVVTVSARLVDEHSSGLTVNLFYRGANTVTPPAFISVPMFDDGTHNDGLASDGIFAAILPAQPTGTIIEFYLQATDLEGHLRTYPNVIAPTNSTRTANLLYQVDAGTYTGSQPIYRIVMTEMERREIYQIGRGCPDMDSDAQMNATWITHDGVTSGGTTTQLRYNAGVRNRGHGSRSSNPNNYHVNVPGDRKWKDQKGINLNSQYAYSQVLGSAIFSKAEMPVAQSRAVQLRVNSTNLMSVVANNSFGSYAANEQYGDQFIARAFPTDSFGNAYRGVREQTICDSTRDGEANLAWYGAFAGISAYTNAYIKENNELANDWSDLIDLVAVMNSANGYNSANYAADVQKRVNVSQWMKYMALNTLLDNTETCLGNGTGDDYALYRGTNDTRFMALPYDHDSLIGRGLTQFTPKHSLFRMTAVPAMDRFMKTPEFAPEYYRWLKSLSETVFSPSEMNPFIDQVLGELIPQVNRENYKAFNAGQVSWVLSQIPLSISISNNLGDTNRTTSSSISLWGRANAITTRKVLVNGNPVTWVGWQATWTNSTVALNPGMNRILVQAFDANDVEQERAYTTIWCDVGSGTSFGGLISADTTWLAANGPYNVTSTVMVTNGATLTIEPGTTLFLGSGVSIVVANGSRLLAEGTTNAPIAFTVNPTSGASWGGIKINGAVGSPETRIANAWFQGNGSTGINVAGGTLSLDQSTFLTTTKQYVSLDAASFLISGCYFPSATTTFELLHGTGGIKAGGRGIFRDCFFGVPVGYNDVIDFTGGNRDKGQPIIQFYNNVFMGATDDILDLDGTDAWIEGNIFMHVHKNGATDSSSAISGGYNGSDRSEITIVGNIFYDCEQAATAKEYNFYTMYNNTIVRTTNQGGVDTDAAVVNVMDIYDNGSTTPFGVGFYLEGNVIYDTAKLVRHYDAAQTTVTFVNNIVPVAWSGPGSNNIVADPLLKYLPQLSETYFTNWQGAQVVRDWFSLQPGSPARRSGPNNLDQGGVVVRGASVSGEPDGITSSTSATLKVDITRTGFAIPAAGWPNGSGFTHYKWRLDEGNWSAETPITTPISLIGLSNGSHHVDVIGKNDAGYYQNDPALGTDAVVTSSRTWVVDTSYVAPSHPTIRINEILAQNLTTLTNAGTLPDLVELYNYGSSTVDLSGMGMSGNTNTPYLFQFPANTLLGAGQYLVLFADKQTTAPGTHLGFAFKVAGESLYLSDKISSGGTLLDSISFGPQIADLSIGRSFDGTWTLCRPTFGTNNLVSPLGNQHQLHINEWLADEQFLANNDFIEIYNPDTRPVVLGGCFLSNSEGAPALNPIPPLSYIAPKGYTLFVADASPEQGPDHLNFKLSPEVGTIFLSDPDLNAIDVISYGPQTTDIAQGRSPSGSDTIVDLLQPTAGGPNPTPNGTTTFLTNVTTSIRGLLDITNVWKYNNTGGSTLGTAWIASAYDDNVWTNGQGLFGYETTPAVYPYPFRTTIPAPAQSGGRVTVFYRTHFTWDGSLTNYTLISTNYIDDGAAFYLNGVKIGAINMPSTYTYSTLASGQPSTEGVPVLLTFTNKLNLGDNVMAVEVHQIASNSSDDVFGMQLNAIQLSTNIVAITNAGISVVLNEVLASNQSITNLDGTTSDWIELCNPSTNAADISDISLSNDANSPRKFVVAPGTILPGRGHLIISCNDKQPMSPTNTGFSLPANGGSIYLFTSMANGGGLIDSITYGLQTADYSVGRVPDATGTWQLNLPTPGDLNAVAGLGSLSSLCVNEWMAAPSTGSDWFELYNRDAMPVSLGGLFLTDDLSKKTVSPIPSLSFIGCGANGYLKFIADGSLSSGADHANFALSKSGEAVGLYSAAGTLIDGITFTNQVTDVSEGRFPDGSTTISSFSKTASPGASNYLPLTNVFINEVLTHTDPPLEDAIEFYNPTTSSVDIGGWFLSNSADDLKKFRVPNGTIISGNGYYVAYEGQFNPVNGSSTPFTLNSAHGDQVYLSQADGSGNLTGYRASASFEAVANGVSLGPITNSSGVVAFVPLATRTFGVDQPATVEQFRTGTGMANSGPLVGPLVINELMFYPPMNGVEDNTQDEYVELRNISNLVMPLYDPLAATNTWKLAGGVDYLFPQGVTIPPGGYALVVNFDPVNDLLALSEFRSRYNITNPVAIFGPYSKQLSNNGERVALYRPDSPQIAPHPDAGFVPYVLVESINYLNSAPWPTGAGGTGQSLQRKVGTSFGDNQSNWFVGATTAGKSNSVDPLDENEDGLPDAWQVLYFGSLASPQAAPGMDSDGDGYSNLQEYVAGTSPVDRNDYLKLLVIADPKGISLHFTAAPDKSYRVLSKSSLSDTAWTTASTIEALAQRREISLPVTNSGARFYRLVTP